LRELAVSHFLAKFKNFNLFLQLLYFEALGFLVFSIFDPLPRKSACFEVDEDVAKTLEVVSPGKCLLVVTVERGITYVTNH